MPQFFDEWIFPTDMFTPDQREVLRDYLPWMLAAAAVFFLLGQISLARRRKSWLNYLGVVGFDAAALALLSVALSTLAVFRPGEACWTDDASYFTAPGGGNRLVVYAMDCGPKDRSIIVSMLKPGEKLPDYNSAVMLYQAYGPPPRVAGDGQNVKVSWTDATNVSVAVAGMAAKDAGRIPAFAGENVYVDLKPLEMQASDATPAAPSAPPAR